MSQAHRPITAVAILFALALPLAACGGGSSTPSSSQGEATTSSPRDASTPPAPSSSQREGAASSSAGSGHSGGGSGGGGSSPAGATAFETQGGDNSIQRYGGEAGRSELSKAAAALHAYLGARAAGNWHRACQSLATGVAKSLLQLGGAQSPPGSGAKPKPPACPQLLAAISAGMPPALRHDLTQADVGALRVRGNSAFLLYHGAHQTSYFMPMHDEHGEWKVAALAASALP